MSVFSRTKRLRRLFTATLLALVAQAPMSTSAQDALTSQRGLAGTQVKLTSRDSRQSIRMVINTSREILTDKPFQRVQIQNPNMLSVVPLEGGNRLQVSALTTTGVTQLDLVDGEGSVHSIEVMVLGDVRELEAVLASQFPGANLQVTPVQQGCIVTGVVTSDEHVEQVITIAEMFFPTVINRVSVLGVHTIQLETQIMEVSRTKLRQLGIDWAIANGNDIVTQSVAGVASNTSTASNLIATGAQTFSVGVIEDSTHFLGVVQALRQNNLVKVLANPTLTAVDGRPASFNAGGEIPIVVPAGLGQVGIQYREFGTRVDMVAKVRGEGRIWLEVRPYLSEIDPTRSVTLQGISVPGLRSRFLETGVELQAGQTLVLGGLLQTRIETINTGLPFFGDLPYVGAIFRNTRELQNEVELLISVTPNFAGPMEPHEVPENQPGTSTTYPTDRELFWRGYMEVPVTGNGNGCGPQGSACAPVNQAGYAVPMSSAQPAAGLIGGQGSQTPTSVSIGPNAPRMATQPMMGNGSAVQSSNSGIGQKTGAMVR
ncbi:MAG: pilus assembly protein N-terminal domain-containing protein [Pirellulales bacterium]